MRRKHLKDRDGDCIDAVLAAVRLQLQLFLRWFQEFLSDLLLILCRRRTQPETRIARRSETFFTDDSLESPVANAILESSHYRRALSY